MKNPAAAALALVFGVTMAGRAMQSSAQDILAKVDHPRTRHLILRSASTPSSGCSASVRRPAGSIPGWGPGMR